MRLQGTLLIPSPNAFLLGKLSFMPTRDGRCFSHMAPEVRRLDAVLARWGQWHYAGLAHLGYPKRSAFMAIFHGGSPSCAEMPEELVDVEQAVQQLAEIRRRVIIQAYTHWEPAEVSARALKMRVTRFRNVLHDARQKLLLILTGYTSGSIRATFDPLPNERHPHGRQQASLQPPHPAAQAAL